MTIDTLLLSRMRRAGIEDGMIRHLHDLIVRGSEGARKASIHYASTAVEGPVRHYSTGEGMTAELTIAPGIQWTGRALRLSAAHALPATVLASLDGRPLSTVALFEGAERMTITRAGTTPRGETFIQADAAKDEPPPRAGPGRRLAYRLTILRADWRRTNTRMTTHASVATLLLAIGTMGMFAPASVAILLNHHALVGGSLLLATIAAAVAVFFSPWPNKWQDADEQHLHEMRELQTRQGW